VIKGNQPHTQVKIRAKSALEAGGAGFAGRDQESQREIYCGGRGEKVKGAGKKFSRIMEEGNFVGQV